MAHVLQWRVSTVYSLYWMYCPVALRSIKLGWLREAKQHCKQELGYLEDRRRWLRHIISTMLPCCDQAAGVAASTTPYRCLHVGCCCAWTHTIGWGWCKSSAGAPRSGTSSPFPVWSLCLCRLKSKGVLLNSSRSVFSLSRRGYVH